MTIYRYAEPSLIDEVRIVKSEGGGVRAYLHAGRTATHTQLETICKSLTEQHWQSFPAQVDGQPLLELRGFKDESEVTALLTGKQFVSGAPTREETKSDRLPFIERVKKNTLRASGTFYILGDIGFATYGYRKFAEDYFKLKKPFFESAWQDMVAGMMYFAGSATLAGFGNADKSEYQLRDISKKMYRFLLKESAQFPEGCSLDRIAKDRKSGLISSVQELFERYPSEIMNSFFALAGLLITTHAWKHETDPTRKALDLGLGVMTIGSGLISALVKEKSPDPTKEKRTKASGIWDWIQEKPLRVAGYGYIASTLCHAGSTYHKYRSIQSKPTKTAEEIAEIKELKKTVGFRALFVGANLVAEMLMALSSKGHGENVKGDASLDHSVAAIAAEMIAAQRPEMQATLIEHMSGFLAHPDVLGGKPSQIADQIRTQMHTIRSNPWSSTVHPDSPIGVQDRWSQKINMAPAALSGPSPV